MPVILEIWEGRSRVSVAEDYTGPIPRTGEYIYVRANVKCVYSVTYRIFDANNKPCPPIVEVALAGMED